METQEFKNLASVSSITENNYKPPIVEIIEISTEKGFADSTTDWGDDTW